MAGKTFPGIGDLEDESLDPADGADSGATPTPSGPLYSGPTVVDDAKLEALADVVRRHWPEQIHHEELQKASLIADIEQARAAHFDALDLSDLI